jgi:predicted RNA-binding protein with PUA-like domain
MPHWLLKTEPSDYSVDDLERDGTTHWDGVANALALKHLKMMRPGDQAIVYHTGNERACVAIAEIVGEAVADKDDPKAFGIDVTFKRRLKTPVTLAVIKADATLKTWDLVRLGRLSVVPTDAATWKRVLALADGK